MKALLIFVLLLAGCSSNSAWKINAGTPHAGAQARVHIHTGSDVAALFGLGLLVGAGHGTERRGFVNDSRDVPALDPHRKVSDQDCTKPLDYSLGNIRCK